ncbi:MAG TPA: Shedu immune nuclease family protein [Candidatus Saccharimonadales bacterium]|nr:Shedu immune nuclease family protein [Candidatus Saccharimonadales bacterium]
MDSAAEEFWQELFTKESWALSQIYAYPLVIVGAHVYVGGKRISNTGGHIVDFLVKNNMTDSAVVVEIKTPETPLLARHPYRSGVYPCSQDLAGAVAQVLQARDSLVRDYNQLTSGEFPEFRTWSPRALLIAGSLPDLAETDQRRSLELYRASLRDLDIVTFDEVVQKVTILVDMLEGG